jgi:hypothetical protein
LIISVKMIHTTNVALVLISSQVKGRLGRMLLKYVKN